MPETRKTTIWEDRETKIMFFRKTAHMTYHMQKCWFEHTSIKFSLKIFVNTFFHWDHMG